MGTKELSVMREIVSILTCGGGKHIHVSRPIKLYT